jgi:hypothetical protein
MYLSLATNGDVRLQSSQGSYFATNTGQIELASFYGNDDIFLTPLNSVSIGSTPGSGSLLAVNQIVNNNSSNTPPFGTAGQVLSSDGSMIQWINPGPPINTPVVVGGAIANTYTLNQSDAGKLLALTTSGLIAPWTLNFQLGNLAVGSTFFIKNMDTTNPITLTYGGVNVIGNDILWPITLGTTNGALCIASFGVTGITVF